MHHPDPSSTSANKNIIWLLRGGTLVCCLILALSLFVFKEGTSHGFCIGLAFGLLVGVSATTLQIRRVELAENTRPADVQSYRIS